MISPSIRVTLILICCLFLVITFALLSIILSFQTIVARRIIESIKIKNGSLIHNSWLAPGRRTKTSIFLFNVTNPDEILAGGRPRLQEVGPYVYWQKKTKTNITWTLVNDHEAVSYYVATSYIFDSEQSVGDPSEDEIISLSLSSVALSSAGKRKSGYFNTLLKILNYLVGPKLFITQPIANFLWGYPDDMMSICNSFLPNKCKTNKLGLLLNANQSISGPYVIDGGNTDITRIGQILRIKNESSTKIWTTSEANKFRGTDGSQFSPNIAVNSVRSVYVSTLCRPLHLIATEISSLSGFPDLQVLLMQLDESNFDSDGIRFCTPNPDGARCSPRGLFDISDCRIDGDIKPSIFASLPHFLHANRSITDSFDGFRSADLEKDSIELYVEPRTGLALEAYSRLQINILVEKSELMKDTFGNIVDELYFPVAWFEEEARADVGDLFKLHTKINTEPERTYKFLICTCIFCFLFALLMMTLLVFPCRLIIYCKKHRKLEIFSEKESNSAQILIAGSSDSESDAVITSDKLGQNPWGHIGYIVFKSY